MVFFFVAQDVTKVIKFEFLNAIKNFAAFNLTPSLWYVFYASSVLHNVSVIVYAYIKNNRYTITKQTENIHTD